MLKYKLQFVFSIFDQLFLITQALDFIKNSASLNLKKYLLHTHIFIQKCSNWVRFIYINKLYLCSIEQLESILLRRHKPWRYAPVCGCSHKRTATQNRSTEANLNWKFRLSWLAPKRLPPLVFRCILNIKFDLVIMFGDLCFYDINIFYGSNFAHY